MDHYFFRMLEYVNKSLLHKHYRVIKELPIKMKIVCISWLVCKSETVRAPGVRLKALWWTHPNQLHSPTRSKHRPGSQTSYTVRHGQNTVQDPKPATQSDMVKTPSRIPNQLHSPTWSKHRPGSQTSYTVRHGQNTVQDPKPATQFDKNLKQEWVLVF